jgi:hypothetical protein
MSSLQETWYLENLIAETRLLTHYFTDTSSQLWGQAADRIVVDGHRSEDFRTIIANVFVKLNGTGDPAAEPTFPPVRPTPPIPNPAGHAPSFRTTKSSRRTDRDRDSQPRRRVRR